MVNVDFTSNWIWSLSSIISLRQNGVSNICDSFISQRFFTGFGCRRFFVHCRTCQAKIFHPGQVFLPIKRQLVHQCHFSRSSIDANIFLQLDPFLYSRLHPFLSPCHLLLRHSKPQWSKKIVYIFKSVTVRTSFYRCWESFHGYSSQTKLWCCCWSKESMYRCGECRR